MSKTLNNKDILKIINEYEHHQKHNLLNISQINMWPLVRIAICFGLISKRYDAETFTKVKTKNKFKNYLNFIRKYNLIKSVIKKDKRLESLEISHDTYLFKFDNKIFDRVHFRADTKNTDTLNKRLNLAHYTLTNEKNDKIEIDLSPVITLLRLCSIPYTLFICLKNYKFFFNFFALYKFFKKKDINIFLILAKIPFKMAYLILLAKHTKYFLHNIPFKSIRHANYYSLDSMAITLGARYCNIPVYHLQHGSQSEDHPAFGLWSNIPKEGYDLLPEVFLCWNKDSINILDNSFKLNKNHSAVLNGYKWVEAWLNEEMPYDFNQLKSLSENNLNVLLTLQPSINGIQDFIEDCIEKSADNVKWWIRIHPRQDNKYTINEIKDKFKDNLSKNIEINIATSSPLPALLSITDIHITGFSSSIFEASYFGVPTVITHKMGLDYYGEHLSNLKAEYCDSSENLMRILMNAQNNKF